VRLLDFVVPHRGKTDGATNNFTIVAKRRPLITEWFAKSVDQCSKIGGIYTLKSFPSVAE